MGGGGTVNLQYQSFFEQMFTKLLKYNLYKRYIVVTIKIH